MSEKISQTRRKSKDSVFVDLFGNVENVLQLYRELHPEDTDVTVEDIQIQTINSVLVNTLYNDLGFLVKDKFVMLVEAQSVWNPNMPLRMLFYLAETYRRYLADTVQSEHSSSKVKLPKPELYVVYSGDKQCPPIVSFSDNFFGEDSAVELKVNVLKEADTTIHGQYIGFCKVFSEQRKIYDGSIMCAKETIRICKEKGYLVSYLRNHEKEVVDMMAELFDEEYLRESYNRANRKNAMEKGRAEGKTEGINKMVEVMRKSGIPEEQIQIMLKGIN